MKYDVKYACGHGSHTIELYGKSVERERKIKWYESNVVCPECYKLQKQQEAQAKGLELHVEINPIDLNTPIVIYFDGDTMPHKDDIKALGYRWGYKPVSGLAGLFGAQKPSKVWSKCIAINELESALKQAEPLQPKVINNIRAIDMAAYRDYSAKHSATQAKIDAIPKPKCPDIINGKRWNGKVYGKSGHYTIYLDGVKRDITDDERDSLLEYLQQREEYNKKITEIKSNE